MEGGGQVWGRDYPCFFHAALPCELNPRLPTPSSRALVPLQPAPPPVPEAQREAAAAFYRSLNGGIAPKPPR